MIDAYIGIGGNLGDASLTVDRAFEALGRIDSTRLLARSSLYRSAPVGFLQQPDFVNAVAHLATTLPAARLLEQLLAIERAHGRRRDIPNGPRTLDLDLLLYGTVRIASPGLVVPHPRMGDRAFVLAPLAEIAPDLDIPGFGRAAERLRDLADQRVERIDSNLCEDDRQSRLANGG